jgi:hypothetical protein
MLAVFRWAAALRIPDYFLLQAVDSGGLRVIRGA